MNNITQRIEQKKLNWLQERQKGIGGSDIAPIFGKSKFKDAFEVYLSKVKPITEISEETGLMKLGHTLEPTIITEYEIQKYTTVDTCVPMQAHPEKAFMLATLDGYDTTNKIIVEAKVCVFNKDQWHDGNKYIIPTQYLLQVAHYCYVMNAPIADVIVYFVNTQEYQIIRYHRDLKLEKVLVDGCTAFWENHVLKQVPPQATSESLKTALRELDLSKYQEEKHVPTPEIIQAIDTCKKYNQEIKELEAKVQIIKSEIFNYCVENKAKRLLNYDTKKVAASFIEYKARKKIDEKLIKEELPEVYEKYSKEVKGYNILKIN